MAKLSVVVPVYNEAGSVATTVRAVQSSCEAAGIAVEVIAVDDGSTDNTSSVLAGLSDIRVIRHTENRGYGAALKTGIRASAGDVIGIIDADGSYPATAFPQLLDQLTDGVDMVVGVRTGPGAAFPLLRRPGKAVVSALATALVGRRIPDLNSGMRLMRRAMIERFLSLVPDGFSFTTTVTLAALTNRLGVRWVPIPYSLRVGTSTMTFRRGLLAEFPNFLVLIVRIITYFRPLRFFVLPSLLFLLVGVLNLVRTIAFDRNITDASMLLIVVGIQIGLMGVIADLIVRSRS